MKLRHLTMMLTLASLLPLAPLCAASESGSDASAGSEQVHVKLEGRAEVQQFNRDMQAWQASQQYRQGAYLMAVNDFGDAAECFRQAGDGFESAIGPHKFVAEARFAEAQCRRLLRQNARAAQLFQIAVDLFQECDPRNPFLKAGKAYLDQLTGGKRPLTAKVTTTQLKGHAQEQQPLELHALRPHNDFIDNHVVLRGKATHLEAGADYNELKDGAYFSGTKLAQNPVTADISDKFVHEEVYKAFLKMTCLEMAALGGNYYTAPDSYKAFKANGKTVLSGATEDSYCPVVDMKLNGREYSVPINLPSLAKGTKNVLLATDGLHVIAIDPRTTDTWHLTPNFTNNNAEFSWTKLSHKKDPVSLSTPIRSTPMVVQGRTPQAPPPRVKSLFGR